MADITDHGVPHEESVTERARRIRNMLIGAERIEKRAHDYQYDTRTNRAVLVKK